MLRDILKDEHKEVVEAELNTEKEERRKREQINRANFPKTSELVDIFREHGFESAGIQNSDEFSDETQKKYEAKYKGEKITFDRKWFSETDNEN